MTFQKITGVIVPILTAFRGADPSAAAAATRLHVIRSGELLLAHLERQGLW